MSKTLKFGIILLVFLCLILGVIILIDKPLNTAATDESIATETPISETQNQEDLVEAVINALADSDGRWQEFNYQIDHIQVQDDGQMAVVWLAAIDPESGEFLGREPELALAEKNEAGEWDILLEDDENFDQFFERFQYADKSILDGDVLTGEQKAVPRGDLIFGGYYLPWAAGLEKRLTWSVGHTSCYPIYYCTHAFDFADGTMFPIVAAKGGTVFHWKDTCANYDSGCTNSITIQDKSTTPWTYQIYLHIAHGSVPDNLKTVGTPVMQGQYIANVDDTGYSSGHHVHFMVVTEDTRYFSYSMESVWGVAEDITFRDVFINWDPVTQGGRPRLAYEAATYGGEGKTYYVSGNQPAHPPTGGLNQPVTNGYINTNLMTVSGWASDDVAVTKVEILADYDGDWVTIGEAPGGNTFSTNINMCETDIPEGVFKLAMRVWDYEGNPSSIVGSRELIKNVACSGDPEVTIASPYLPTSGFVSADVVKGSTGSEITSVEFWFHGRDWNVDDWVHLGKDTYGTNGWRAPISTTNMVEADDYVLLAVATDALGNQGADVLFNAMVDRTEPWVEVAKLPLPIKTYTVTLTWTAGDNLSGLDHYSIAVKIDDGSYQLLSNNLPSTTTSYKLDIGPEQLMVVSLTAYDKAGNENNQKIVMFSEGYDWPYQYILFPVYNGCIP